MFKQRKENGKIVKVINYTENSVLLNESFLVILTKIGKIKWLESI